MFYKKKTFPLVYFTHEYFAEFFGPLWIISMLESERNKVKQHVIALLVDLHWKLVQFRIMDI